MTEETLNIDRDIPYNYISYAEALAIVSEFQNGHALLDPGKVNEYDRARQIIDMYEASDKFRTVTQGAINITGVLVSLLNTFPNWSMQEGQVFINTARSFIEGMVGLGFVKVEQESPILKPNGGNTGNSPIVIARS